MTKWELDADEEHDDDDSGEHNTDTGNTNAYVVVNLDLRGDNNNEYPDGSCLLRLCTV